VVALLEKEFGKAGQKEMLPMQPGDVEATYADIAALEREIGGFAAIRAALTCTYRVGKPFVIVSQLLGHAPKPKLRRFTMGISW
jgi:hypothetical protein